MFNFSNCHFLFRLMVHPLLLQDHPNKLQISNYVFFVCILPLFPPILTFSYSYLSISFPILIPSSFSYSTFPFLLLFHFPLLFPIPLSPYFSYSTFPLLLLFHFYLPSPILTFSFLLLMLHSLYFPYFTLLIQI